MIADIIIIGAILFYCGFLIVRWIRNRRFPEGGCCGCSGCSGSCVGCSGSCRHVSKGAGK
ncbi:MAG TPA: FeoB-associated Cys-rich membrane protein [Candidatus Fimimorpha excrementavium]|nr:FeoB-associated Cys-rich membrane protein [Candidatus Fimimorpha excrementavium]